MSTSTERLDERALRAWPLPGGSGSKYERGQVLVVGGSASAPGAVILAGMAALRVGAGRLTLAVPGEVASAIAVAVPEGAVLPLGGRHDELSRAGAVLIGPGLDDPDRTEELMAELIPQLDDRAVVVLDAFALGVLPRTELAEGLRGRLVLTPNREEAERLLGRPLGDDLAGLREIADRFGAAVTCFGTIAAPGGTSWTVSAESEHLGTSGSGDVLAGAVTGLLARGAPPDQAAAWATHLHHRAGQLAGHPAGALGYLARDLVAALPAALAELS